MKRFIHIPKTAGIAIKHWLCDVDEIVMCGNSQITKTSIITKRQHKRGWLSESSEKFTVVRNPYERCVSAYAYLIKENTRIAKDISFEFFIKEYVLDKENKTDTWQPQIWWFFVHGKKAIDKVIRFENLENELQNYFKNYKPLSKHNSSNIQNYMSYYTTETKDLVYRFYKQDFEYFGYNR